MEKKVVNLSEGTIKCFLKKNLLKMKLTVLCLLLSFAQLLASKGFSQSQAKLTLNLENARLEEVLLKIEQQSNLYFIYNREVVDVDRKINVSFTNEEIGEVLSVLFDKSGVEYDVRGSHIILKENSAQAAQQARKVSGKVTDTSGISLPGVTVVIKNTTQGTITGVDGSYTLTNVPADAVLAFSFVGMKTQEILVAGKSSIDVILEEETVGIEEVVAIGYGTMHRKDLTGSVASVSGSSLKDIPVSSAGQAITGRLAGVQVTQVDGSPDAEIMIRVRGGGSLTQDNSPLYLVDGFPVDNIDDIAPTDIASIDVLKDASSTAIYGARGANGVILITTTKGNFERKGKVKYNMYYGVKNITKTLDVLNPYEFSLLMFERFGKSVERYLGSFEDIDLYKQIKGTNWQDEVFGRTGTNMYHNLAFSGGSKTSTYNISLTRNDDKAIMLGSVYSRTNLVINTSQKVNDWLTVDMNTRLSDMQIKGAGAAAISSTSYRLMQAVQYRPVNGLSDYVDESLSEGEELYYAENYNPVLMIEDEYKRKKNLKFSFNGGATISPMKNLKYRFEFGIQYGQNRQRIFYGIETPQVQKFGIQPIANKINTHSTLYRMANILTYSKRDFLPGSNLTAMIGEELTYSKTETINSGAKYFPKYIDAASALAMMNLGMADPIATNEYAPVKVSSFFGRLNYDYKGKYLASATVRADGSSLFAPGNQWGYFPSAGLSWRISDENFMASEKRWLDNLKLRVSYGKAGNNRIPIDSWKRTFSTSTYRLSMGGKGEGDQLTTFIKPSGVLANSDLKWETTVTRNIGLDFGLFKQRLNGSVDIYKNTTKDLLISASIPGNTGYSSQWQNIGQTSNKGIEISLDGAIVKTKDFSLSGSFNIGFNKNHIDKLGEAKTWLESSGFIYWVSGEYQINEGGQIGEMYGFETDGMYAVDDFDYADGNYSLKEGVPDGSSVIGVADFGPGSMKLKDQNGDEMITLEDDRVIIGNANPKHTGGFNLEAQYKGFDLSAFFNWVYGNDIFNANKFWGSINSATSKYRNLFNIMNSDNRFMRIDKVTGETVTDPAQLAQMNKDATIWTPQNSMLTLYDWAIEDGSFLRLNTLTLGYSLPKNLLDKYGIGNLRIYASAYNLWTWTRYSGFDPEVNMRRSSPLTPGVDWNGYPRSRSFNIGLNVEF